MTPALWISLIVAVCGGGGLYALLTFRWMNRKIKAETRDRSDKTPVEVESISVTTMRESLSAQQGVIGTLSAEIERQKLDAAAQDRRITNLESQSQDFQEQAELAAKAAVRAEEAARLAQENLRACQQQNRLLRESLSKSAQWQAEHWAEHHPDGAQSPPQVLAFREVSPKFPAGGDGAAA